MASFSRPRPSIVAPRLSRRDTNRRFFNGLLRGRRAVDRGWRTMAAFRRGGRVSRKKIRFTPVAVSDLDDQKRRIDESRK